MSNLIVSTLNDLDSFASLKMEWNALLEKSNSGTVFLTWEWLYTWWCKFHNGRTLNIVTIRDDHGNLVGIGPFCINSKWGRLPIKTLSFLGISPISSEYLDIIVNPKNEKEVASTVFNYLYSEVPNWECLILTDTLNTSCVYRYFKILASAKRFVLKESIKEECPYLKLELTQEAMLSKFKSQLKSTIKRRTKKLDQMGVSLKVVETEEDLGLYLKKLFKLHQQCWNERGIEGNFSDELIKLFHIDLTKRLLSGVFLRLYALDLEGKTIATLYTFQYKNTLFYYQSGYDTDWSSYSPGTVLMWKCITDSIDRGILEFDYLRGNEFYKSLWSDRSKNTYSLVFIPPYKIKARMLFYLVDRIVTFKLLAKKMISLLKR